MKDPTSLHDDEWAIGWKSSDTAFDNEGRFQFVSDIVSPLAPNAIFDVGCGNGLQAEMLKKTMPEVIVRGCDISSAAIEKASNRMDLCYICNIDNSDLPEESEIYDLVLCVAVLEHLYDVSHALKEIHRILKPGKHVLIQVPNVCFWRFRLEILIGKLPYILRDPRHLHIFSKGFLNETLEHAGFTCLSTLGQRERIKKLATLFPSLFSEDIFVLAMKHL